MTGPSVPTPAGDPPEPLDLDAVRADLAEIAQRWEDHDEDLYGLLAASGKLLEHGRRMADELEDLRKLTAVCSCYDGNPANYEGAHWDCLVHGAIRAYNEAVKELEQARADLAELRELVADFRAIAEAGIRYATCSDADAETGEPYEALVHAVKVHQRRSGGFVMDSLGWFIATLHGLLGHDKTAAFLGQPPGNRDDCLICQYERKPSDPARQAVILALAAAVRKDTING